MITIHNADQHKVFNLYVLATHSLPITFNVKGCIYDLSCRGGKYYLKMTMPYGSIEVKYNSLHRLLDSVYRTEWVDEPIV